MTTAKRFCILLVTTTGLLGALGIAAFCTEATASFRSPEEKDYGEGIVLWQALKITDAHVAYRPLGPDTWVVFHYPPVFHLASRGLALAREAAMGAPASAETLLASGRLVSIFSTAGICILLGVFAWNCLRFPANRTAQWLGSIAAGTLIFTTPLWYWGCLMRVDCLAILLSVAGLLLFTGSRTRPVLAYTAFLCFVTAAYTKQTAVAAPAVCLLAAFIETPRRAIRILAMSALAGVVILFTANFVTNGGFFRHLFVYAVNPYSVKRLAHNFDAFLPPWKIMLAVPFLLWVTTLIRLFPSRRSLRQAIGASLGGGLLRRGLTIFSLYTAAAMAMSLTVGKEGSSYNYFLEAGFGASLLCGLIGGWLVTVAERNSRRYQMPMVFFLILILFQMSGTIRALRDALHIPDGPGPDTLTENIRQFRGPVYSEEMTSLVRAGKEVVAEPAVITSLSKLGRIDETPLVRRIEKKQFSAIVIVTSLDYRERFTPRVANAVRQYYVVQKRSGPESGTEHPFEIYVPR